MSKPTFYIGFGTLEELLNAGKFTEIFLKNSCTSVQGQMNMTFIDWFVTAGVFTDKACLYWRMHLGSYNCPFYGDPLFTDQEYVQVRDARGESVVRLLTEYLQEQNYNVLPGHITFPKHHVLFKGTTKLLVFNKETQTFSRHQEVSPLAA